MNMVDIMSKLHLILPALLILNLCLSTAAQVLAILGKKEIPVISQACVMLKKAIDFLSANVQH
jgi:hypothetical protein